MELILFGDQGAIALVQDAAIRVWHLNKITGAQLMGKATTYGWPELNSRGVEKAKPFYKKMFGWGEK